MGLDLLMEKHGMAEVFSKTPAPQLWVDYHAEINRAREWCDLAWNLCSYPVNAYSSQFTVGRILIFVPGDILLNINYAGDLDKYETLM